jgi:hypothetical protein
MGAGQEEPLMGIIIAILAVLAIISITYDKLDDLFFYLSPYLASIWGFVEAHFFLFCALTFILFAVVLFVYFRPHPSEKHFNAYKKDLITRDQAIERIANTMYNYRRDPLPSVRKSRSLERRVQALRKRVKAEEAFINDLISYIKTRARME